TRYPPSCGYRSRARSEGDWPRIVGSGPADDDSGRVGNTVGLSQRSGVGFAQDLPLGVGRLPDWDLWRVPTAGRRAGALRLSASHPTTENKALVGINHLT